MIAIIDYGLGNLTSVLNAFEKIGIPAKITSDSEEIEAAERIILPGVGAFGEGMENLRKTGLINVLKEEVLNKKKPFLGICLGMQLLFQKGYEGGEFEGLGWIKGAVVKFDGKELRIPHVGWNDVQCDLDSPILNGGRETQTFYFVHSYYVQPAEERLIVGNCNYGADFCAILQSGNIFGVQFHPEKSQQEGLEILRKFASYRQGEEQEKKQVIKNAEKKIDSLLIPEERPPSTK